MAARKEIMSIIRLRIPAGRAKPAPPVGTVLGGAGLNIMGFCKDFNARTQHIIEGVPIPVVITAYKDKSFTYETRQPPNTYFIKKAAGIEKGASRPGYEVAGYISLKHVYEIAETKMKDPNLKHLTMKQMCSQIISTAKSMGVGVVPKPEDAPTTKQG